MKIIPIEAPRRAAWRRPFSYSDYTKMLKGFSPEDMDQRWAIQTDQPDVQGTSVVHICRSWTGHEYYAFTITAGKHDQKDATRWGVITEIIWMKKDIVSEDVSEAQAKETAVNWSRALMGCELADG